MSEHDITAMLDREAGALPPPPVTDVDTVLRAGDRRRRRRHGGYAMAAAAAVAAVAGVGMSLGTAPDTIPEVTQPSPEVAQPFGPVLAAVPVCGSEGRCQPVEPEMIEQTLSVIEASGVAEVMEVQDAEEVASGLPSEDGSSPPEEWVQSLASRVILRVDETTDPTALFRELVSLPFVDSVQVGTANVAPHLFPGDNAAIEEPNSPVEPTEYGSLSLPVVGRDHPVTFSTHLNELGQLCLESPGGSGCGWTEFRQGLMVGAGPWTDSGENLRCVEGFAGYDVSDVVIELSDDRTVPTGSFPARTDLPHPRVVAGCWIGTDEDITVIGYDTNGDEVARESFTEPEFLGPDSSPRPAPSTRSPSRQQDSLAQRCDIPEAP